MRREKMEIMKKLNKELKRLDKCKNTLTSWKIEKKIIVLLSDIRDVDVLIGLLVNRTYDIRLKAASILEELGEKKWIEIIRKHNLTGYLVQLGKTKDSRLVKSTNFKILAKRRL